MGATVGATAEASLGVTLVQRRGWAKADIKRVPHLDGQAILKDFADKSPAVRFIGRLQMRREIRALDRLRGVAGIPRCHAEVPPCGLLIELIEGERITRWRRRPPVDIARMFERLDRLVEALHARGVVHLDLRKRDNILITSAGQPRIIDFNASLCLEPGSLLGRLLLPLLRLIDDSAVLKWKSRLAPHLLTPRERRRHRLMSLVRRFWILN